MENYKTLPVGYREIEKIDLSKNKKQAVLVNALAIMIGIIMTFIPIFTGYFDYFSELFKPEISFSEYVRKILIPVLIFAVALIAYTILHEIVHGIFMKKFSGVKPSYGFTGLYAYAGSSAYFNKKCYIIIALAPIVIWGIVLLLLQIFLPEPWNLIAYAVQIMNISGAAGDIYVTYKMSRMPNDILVNDTGVSMVVFSKELLN